MARDSGLNSVGVALKCPRPLKKAGRKGLCSVLLAYEQLTGYAFAMLQALKSLFFSERTAASGSDPVALATAVLLVEAGTMDGTFDAQERESVLRLLGRQFSLDEAAARRLLEAAIVEAERSTELYSHSRTVKDKLSYEERLDIIEMLWEVVYADGHLHDFEANLMRRLNRLLFVEDVDSGLARKRVLGRLGLA